MTIGSTVQVGIRVCVVALLLSGCAADADRGNAAILDSLKQAAATAEDNGDYANAAGRYRELTHRLPDDVAMALGLARNLRYAGQAKMAVDSLDKAAGKFGDVTAFKVERGKANLAVGNVNDAVRFLIDARARDEGNWEIHAALGIAYDLLESFAKARASYERALALSKGNPVVLNNMAISAALAGDIDRAIAILEKAPKAARHSPQIRQNLALFYGIKGDMDKAEALARMDLDEASVRNNLAVFARLRANRTAPPAPAAKSK